MVRRRLLVASAAALVGVGPVGAAAGATGQAADVSSGAYGFSASVSIFGGEAVTVGPRPTVTLPSEGTPAPATASAPSGKAQIGPARVFQSKALKVSTKVSTGPKGEVTSSSQITGDPGDPQGPKTVAYTRVTSSCRATVATRSGSASIAGGVLATSTNADGDPANTEAIPANPPPNYTRTGAVTNIGDTFKAVFNEQIEGDTSIAVNAVHLYLLGPAAVGDIIIGQSRCATPSAAALAAAAAASSTGSGPDLLLIALGALGVVLLAVVLTVEIRRRRAGSDPVGASDGAARRNLTQHSHTDP